MFGAFERMVAFRYLRARRAEGLISVIAAFSLIGIMLGVGTLIVVMSVMNGFRAEFLKQILGFDGDITVLSRSAPAPLTGFDAIATALARVPGVVRAVPIVDGQVLLRTDRTSSVAMLRGLRRADAARNPDLADHLFEGSLDALDDDSILLGYQVAARLGVHVGDSVTLVSPDGTPTPFGIVPRQRQLRVAATFDTGFYQFDNGWGVVSLAAAQRFFALPEGVSSIQLFVADPQAPARYRDPMAQAAGAQAKIVDWQERPSALLTALKTERLVMFFILTLIILVAAFNIVSSMIMLVRSKGRDIAILRTMGATRSAMLRIFFLAGASIGAGGTLLGLIIGLAFARNIDAIRTFMERFRDIPALAAEIDFLSRLPAEIDGTQVAIIAALGFGLSFLATLYPAWRAARLDPTEALRYE
jgi:lipoprotein-releasing system permease protein